MKKFLFLCLAFGLMSFAKPSANLEEESLLMECVSAETTCGKYGTVCGETDVDRALLAVYLDDWICGE